MSILNSSKTVVNLIEAGHSVALSGMALDTTARRLGVLGALATITGAFALILGSTTLITKTLVIGGAGALGIAFTKGLVSGFKVAEKQVELFEQLSNTLTNNKIC